MALSLDIQIIKRARQLIEKKEDWFGGDSGPPTESTRFFRQCAVLALNEAFQELLGREILDRDSVLKKRFKMTTTDLINFNNTHKHVEVLSLFDKVLQQA